MEHPYSLQFIVILSSFKNSGGKSKTTTLRKFIFIIQVLRYCIYVTNSNHVVCYIRRMIVDYSTNLLKNIHESLPTFGTGKSTIIRGIYEYWHYGCDGFNDRGWGCGYRTLQTICSWIIINKNLQEKVPSIRKIQETLVTLEDKEKPFIGSRDWIGCFEVCLILDNLYNVNSKIVHIRSGQELSKYLHVIRQHFEEFGCPIMMGGDQDCSSKCIIGVHIGLKEVYLLIVDPHFIGKAKSIEELKSNQWVRWQSIRDFVYSSFYNLCLPQIKIT